MHRCCHFGIASSWWIKCSCDLFVSCVECLSAIFQVSDGEGLRIIVLAARVIHEFYTCSKSQGCMQHISLENQNIMLSARAVYLEIVVKFCGVVSYAGPVRPSVHQFCGRPLFIRCPSCPSRFSRPRHPSCVLAVRAVRPPVSLGIHS